MHAHDELLDLWGEGFISDETLFSWYQNRYSTSKHLLTLYSYVRGTGAKNVIEIGFGRSSFILARATAENGGKFTTVDKRNFDYLFSDREKLTSDLLVGYSDVLWADLKKTGKKIDFAFLDYFSDSKCDADFCRKEIGECVQLLSEGGAFAIHDTIERDYPISGLVHEIAEQFQCEVLTFPYNYGLSLFRKKYQGSINDPWKKKQ
ncbi:MAG: class I SAM-dependent methyltransferase [Verrucomicrobiota bacterium]